MGEYCLAALSCIILATMLISVEGRKCYSGSLATKKLEKVDCSGSCFSNEDYGVVGCSDKLHEEGCVTSYHNTITCYCNKELCTDFGKTHTKCLTGRYPYLSIIRCSGSCFSLKGYGLAGCAQKVHSTGCVQAFGGKFGEKQQICYCNENLCGDFHMKHA